MVFPKISTYSTVQASTVNSHFLGTTPLRLKNNLSSHMSDVYAPLFFYPHCHRQSIFIFSLRVYTMEAGDYTSKIKQSMPNLFTLMQANRVKRVLRNGNVIGNELFLI